MFSIACSLLVGFHNVQVTSYSLSLYEIDTIQGSGNTFIPSAVETILRKVCIS